MTESRSNRFRREQEEFESAIISRTAAEVIQASDRQNPADRVLRDLLRNRRDLNGDEASEISAAVFNYYRWSGWLDQGQDIEAALRQARDLRERFSTNPGGFSSEALRAHAVPGWTAEEVALDDDWLRSLQREPKLWLRARRGQGRALAGKLRDCHPFGEGKLADTLEYSGNIDLFRTPEFHAGEFELQDLSSQAVGLVCDPQPGETWWDACAGEGGKLLHLSELMENKGLIWASDRAAWRLKQLKRRTARAGVFNYRAAAWNGGAALPTRTRFDGVLVDAPCTGVGTWQRNPHARWTTTLNDVKELSALQSQLLAHAAKGVKPGGKLVYSVCTVTRSETEAVAAKFEKEFPAFEAVPIVNPLAPAAAPAARLWFWPQQFGGNGMFIAVWKKSQPVIEKEKIQHPTFESGDRPEVG